MNGAWKQSQENYRSTVPWCSLEDRKQIIRLIDFGVPNLKQSWCQIKLCLSLFTLLTILFPCLNQEHFEYPIISVFLMLSIGFWRVTCSISESKIRIKMESCIMLIKTKGTPLQMWWFQVKQVQEGHAFIFFNPAAKCFVNCFANSNLHPNSPLSS